MILESILASLEPKQKIAPLLLMSVFSALGCATAAPYQENQGGNAGTYQEGGSAGFEGKGGFGGTGGSEEMCIPNTSAICHNEDIYWQDSCGNLGELLEDCSGNQLCEGSTVPECVYDCSLVTPTSECLDQNCYLYDSFEYGLCNWVVGFGTPANFGGAAEGKLTIEGNAVVEVKEKIVFPSTCNSDFIATYTAALLYADTAGSLKITHRNENPYFSGLTLTHYPNGYLTGENNKIIVDCNGVDMATVGDYDLHLEKELKVKKIGNELQLEVDGVFAASVLCNDTSTPTPVNAMYVSAGSAGLLQAMKIDDVMLYCPDQSN